MERGGGFRASLKSSFCLGLSHWAATPRAAGIKTQAQQGDDEAAKDV